MSTCALRLPAALLTTACLCAGTGAQIVISSTFDIAVEADADQNAGGFSIDSFSASQFGTINPYTHSLSVTNMEAGGGYVTTTSSAAAQWTNAGAGTVSFRNMGWTRDSLMMHEAKMNNFLVGADVWSYTFQATSDGQFSMNYNVSYTGWGFGLLGIVIHWDGLGGGLDLESAFDPTASGSFVRPIVAGTTYTVGISNSGNIFAAAGQGYSEGHMNGDFDWNIGAVPEPASLSAVAIGGLALAFARRKKR